MLKRSLLRDTIVKILENSNLHYVLQQKGAGRFIQLGSASQLVANICIPLETKNLFRSCRCRKYNPVWSTKEVKGAGCSSSLEHCPYCKDRKYSLKINSLANHLHDHNQDHAFDSCRGLTPASKVIHSGAFHFPACVSLSGHQEA